MERTGHRDVRSLQRYQRPNVQQKIEISRAFDLSLSHEETNLDYAEVSNIKNVIDCSKKEVEIDTLNTKDKVKRLRMRRVKQRALHLIIVLFLCSRTF